MTVTIKSIIKNVEEVIQDGLNPVYKSYTDWATDHFPSYWSWEPEGMEAQAKKLVALPNWGFLCASFTNAVGDNDYKEAVEAIARGEADTYQPPDFSEEPTKWCVVSEDIGVGTLIQTFGPYDHRDQAADRANEIFKRNAPNKGGKRTYDSFEGGAVFDDKNDVIYRVSVHYLG